ncbi:hypothetical protein Tco_0174810 [Tanacetum coccineum]
MGCRVKVDRIAIERYYIGENFVLLHSWEVNADDIADKSLSRASMQPITQSKAPTNLKIRRKRISPSSKPESQYKVRAILTKKPVAETQHAKVTIAAADATNSQVASELVGDQGNQPSAAYVEKVQDQKIEEVKESELDPMEDATFDQIMDEIDERNKDVGKAENAPDSGLHSMPDDDLASLTSFETQDYSDHFSDAGTETLHAYANKPAQLDPLGHLHEELPGLLKDALKYTLPQSIKDSIKNSVLESIAEELPQVEAQVQKNLQD